MLPPCSGSEQMYLPGAPHRGVRVACPNLAQVLLTTHHVELEMPMTRPACTGCAAGSVSALALQPLARSYAVTVSPLRMLPSPVQSDYTPYWRDHA